jgi:hypothetical protein
MDISLWTAVVDGEQAALAPPCRPAQGGIQWRLKHDRRVRARPKGEHGKIASDQFGVTRRERFDVGKDATVRFNNDVRRLVAPETARDR